MVPRRAAAAVRAVFVDYDARFEAGSLDEAYLDVTDYCRQHGLTGRHQDNGLMQTCLVRQVCSPCASRMCQRLACCVALARGVWGPSQALPSEAVQQHTRSIR